MGEKLEFADRLLPQARSYDGVPVAIVGLPDGDPRIAEGLPLDVKPVVVVVDLEALSAQEAIEKCGRILESIIDLISFEMGSSLPLGQVTAVDVTPPTRVGDEREMMTWSSPPSGRNREQVQMEAVQGRLEGRLPESIGITDSRLAAALRWFVKALNTNLLHDQYIFLWIALEILSEDSDGDKILAPYKGPCGHVIGYCQDCGRATESLARGATLRAFLEATGIEEKEARELWAMRQLMHGAIPFDSKKLENLASLVQTLRAVSAGVLKARLGIKPSDPPLVAPSGLAIHPAMGAGGTRLLSEEETQPLPTNTAP